ncbi:Hsp70 family protein [Microseira sp. BLCC-F43]|uniref:Hsp70 family protein n=1 Tax=Microseira sp. BLCC-F43 TaxID=3153602 RepID=UPI0035BB0C29
MNEVDILGIDLGTTNSAIAIWEPGTGQARVLHNCEGDRITPSVVKFDPQTRQPIVGKSALSCITSHPGQVIYSVKRFIGCTFRDERVRNDQTQVTYSIEEVQQHKVAVRVGEQILTPPQISAQVLRKLKQDTEEELTRLRRVINKEKTSDTLLLESLDNLELSIQDRNVTQAEKLLAELKSKL